MRGHVRAKRPFRLDTRNSLINSVMFIFQRRVDDSSPRIVNLDYEVRRGLCGTLSGRRYCSIRRIARDVSIVLWWTSICLRVGFVFYVSLLLRGFFNGFLEFRLFSFLWNWFVLLLVILRGFF